MEGIYRVSAPLTQINELRRAIDNHESFNFPDPHCAVGLLKLFLRELPEPPLTHERIGLFEDAAQSKKTKNKKKNQKNI